MAKSALERFEDKYTPEPNSGCWLWTATVAGRMKYGHFWDAGKKIYAHRWAYEHYVGKIPDGFQLDHLCRIPTCVNPAHLEPVTRKENLARGNGATARNSRKTRCRRGHALSGENLSIVFWSGSHRRICRTCRLKKRTTL